MFIISTLTRLCASLLIFLPGSVVGNFEWWLIVIEAYDPAA